MVSVADSKNIARAQAVALSLMPSAQETNESFPTGIEENTSVVLEQVIALLESSGKEYGRRLLRSNSKGASSFPGSDAIQGRNLYKTVEAF